jgi:NADH dehydrogenase [ubiquinone] 1 alpha subcomplex assembly factor 1
MNTALAILMMLALVSIPNADYTIDFGRADGKVSDWVVLSDNVMGGITTSNLAYADDALILTGDVSLANYGGFSSVKTRFNRFDLSPYKGLKIRYKASNQSFAFTLENSKNWTRPNYKGALPKSSVNAWTEATIAFKDFAEYQIGEPTGDKLDPAILTSIVRLGIITTEKKEGPFSLEVDYIAFIR